MDYLDKIGSDYIFFDGAMGTMLQKNGIKAGKIPEEWNIEQPSIIRDIHRLYIENGANIITTNTFGANRYKLKKSQYDVNQIISSGVRIAKSVSGNHIVALDIGPIGQLLEPLGTLSFDDAYDCFKEQVIAGRDAGADIILIETISDLYEAKAAILAAKENCKLKIFCTMTFDENGRTLTGTDTRTMVEVLEGLGVDVLGINCSLGPKQIKEIAKEVFAYARVPVMIQPNAGLPRLIDGETVFTLTPSEYAQQVSEIAKLGGSIYGGCCGTDPRYIKELITKLSNDVPVKRNNKRYTIATSSTKAVILDDEITVIGERINPSGKKRLKQAVKNGELSYITKQAIVQIEAGADVLDINMGMTGIDEEETMVSIVKELQSIIDTPLQIDSMKASVIEKAVRYYNGKPIINSVNGKRDSIDTILPIAKKYGALIIGLTLDEDGLPDSTEKRVEIAKKIIKSADDYGIPRENIIIDCLTLTASAEQSAVIDTLEAIKIIKSKYGVKTTLGASNISFGLPSRQILNNTFLAMAMTYGLDAPITDPTVSELMDTIRSFRVLNNIDRDSQDYINYYSEVNKDIDKRDVITGDYENNDIIDIVIKGLKEEVGHCIKELLRDIDPMSIINDYLIKALDIVGERYEKGVIFLPQLIRSAETVKIAFDILKENIKNAGEGLDKGSIILATVKGDVHDIGKNIVKILLENYGYRVIDLGKDVGKEKIFDIAMKEEVKLIGLSALMTTTVSNMEEIIQYVSERDDSIRFMVGGAVLTEDYAKKIKAKYYGKDAREAVAIAREFFS